MCVGRGIWLAASAVRTARRPGCGRIVELGGAATSALRHKKVTKTSEAAGSGWPEASLGIAGRRSQIRARCATTARDVPVPPCDPSSFLTSVASLFQICQDDVQGGREFWHEAGASPGILVLGRPGRCIRTGEQKRCQVAGWVSVCTSTSEGEEQGDRDLDSIGRLGASRERGRYARTWVKGWNGTERQERAGVNRANRRRQGRSNIAELQRPTGSSRTVKAGAPPFFPSDLGELALELRDRVSISDTLVLRKAVDCRLITCTRIRDPLQPKSMHGDIINGAAATTHKPFKAGSRTRNTRARRVR